MATNNIKSLEDVKSMLTSKGGVLRTAAKPTSSAQPTSTNTNTYIKQTSNRWEQWVSPLSIVAQTVNNNLQQEKTLKKEVAKWKAIQFFNDRSDIRKNIIEWKITSWNKEQDNIWNNRSELADAIRLLFIDAWYEGTDWFGDEMLFDTLYWINPKAKQVVDYYSVNWWDANTYAYYIMHPEYFEEDNKDASLFQNVVWASYDVATWIPRTLARRWAKWIWAIAKWLWWDAEKIDYWVNDYINYANEEFAWRSIWADEDALSYKVSKWVWELALILAWEWLAKNALRWVDIAWKIWMWNAPTWVKWLTKWVWESLAEWIWEQALDDMVEQELSSLWQYWVNIWVNAFFNWLWEIGWSLLRPNEKMTTTLKNIDVDAADDIVKQTKNWVKDPLWVNPLDKKLDEVADLAKDVASDKSTAWQIIWRVRDFMKSDVTRSVTSSLDDINAALNKIDDLWWVQIIKKADWTFELSQKVLWWGKELEEFVQDLNILIKNSDNLRWYDQVSRLLNKYAWDASAAWRKQLSTALKSASDTISEWVDDALSKYFVNEAGKLYPQSTTALAVRWADAAWDAMPNQFFTDLKSIYWEWKSNYKLLSEFQETLEALTDDSVKWMKKLTDIFGNAWWDNYYKFLKSLDDLWYKRAWKLADEIVGTVYTMWLYGKDLIEDSVKKFYPSVPWLYELWIKSALDVAKKNIMWIKQIAAGKTSAFNPVRDAIRWVTSVQYLNEINK